MPKVYNFNPLARKEDKEYLESGNWKCSKSPSKAHYWLISDGDMKCKYCSEVRDVDHDIQLYPRRYSKKH